MAITHLQEIWLVINEKLPRDELILPQAIYELIQRNIDLRPDDFLPSAPNSGEPKLFAIQDPTREIGRKLILTPINFQVQINP
jgi:hypothetical protein